MVGYMSIDGRVRDIANVERMRERLLFDASEKQQLGGRVWHGCFDKTRGWVER